MKVAKHALLERPAGENGYASDVEWVNAILDNMSERLRKRDILDDVRCPVKFELDGATVTSFGQGDGLAFALTAHTRLARRSILNKVTGVDFIMVKDSVWLDGNNQGMGVTIPKRFPTESFAWFTWGYYPSIVAIKNSDNNNYSVKFDGYNWTHEYGHRKGLNEDLSHSSRIMFQGITPPPPPLLPWEGTTVSPDQAKAFRKK